MKPFVVGIDLGTTNCALSYLPAPPNPDPSEMSSQDRPERSPPEPYPIPQLVRPGDVQSRPTLPSFIYLCSPNELPEGSLDLPWTKQQTFLVGEAARERGAQVPGRLVSSSKSWLSHHAAPRENAILPPKAEDIEPISPVEAATRYLNHLKSAWNTVHPTAHLEAQNIYLTVPASFDAVARELTLRAAQDAGFTNTILLEEPQAAFYAWLAQMGDRWRKILKPHDRVLVCDVGGGTSDFSLIEVLDNQGALELHRVAVGDHLLLGGDNMDLALGHVLHQQLLQAKKKLDLSQQQALVLGARRAKEALFSQPKLEKQSVTVLGQGRRLFGNKLSVDLTRKVLEQVVLEGFLPICEANSEPQEAPRTGFLELGLPYVFDPAITRHLAHFLHTHAADRPPTHILFNGGVFNAPTLRARLLEVMGQWGIKPQVLEGGHHDLAVSLGAAWYGGTRESGGVRIRGGTARSYWIGVEVARPAIPGLPPPTRALCVVPHGMEEGTEVEVEGQTLGLVVGQAVEFQFYSSSTRVSDKVGTVLDEYTWPETLEETTPVTVTLKADDLEPGTVVPVKLQAQLTEVGTLHLWCVSQEDGRRFRLAFSTR